MSKLLAPGAMAPWAKSLRVPREVSIRLQPNRHILTSLCVSF